MTREPLYLRVKKDLVARIGRGVWLPGSYIPSEPQLCQHYGVSRTTVRKAVEELAGEGQLAILRGRGTQVVAPRLSLKPAVLMSFTQLMRSQGLEPGQRDESLDLEPATAEVAAALALAPGSPVVRLQRVRTADGGPISLTVSYLPQELFGGFDLQPLGAGQSLYAQLEDGFNVVVHTTEDVFGIATADPRTAAQLQVDPGEPLLLMTRSAFDKAGRPVEYGRVLIRADRYHHTITLRRK